MNWAYLASVSSRISRRFLYSKFEVMKKESALKAMEHLPEEFPLDELIERLIFVEKIEEGIQAMRDGDVLTDEQMRAEIESWKREAQAGKMRSNAA